MDNQSTTESDGPRRPVALVTGASAGIGAGMARELARRGHDLVLVARRQERLEGLATELERDHGAACTLLGMDLARPEAAAAIEDAVIRRGLAVDVLVNNAGYGVPGAYLSSPWHVHQTFLQVMVGAVAELSWRLAAPMVERGHGRIINVASLAGLMPGTAGHTLYGAVKTWMIRFSESLAAELEPRGVSVTAVCPGFTYTEFHDVNHMRERVSKMPGYLWMDCETVVRQSIDAAERGKRVAVIGRVNTLIAGLARYLPRWLMLRLVLGRSSQFRDSD